MSQALAVFQHKVEGLSQLSGLQSHRGTPMADSWLGASFLGGVVHLKTLIKMLLLVAGNEG